MNILVIDTATEACSVALQWKGEVYAEFDVCPQQHSRRIFGMVDAVLTKADASLEQLDGLAFGRGPGSFTGVRIATGVIQGLALGANLPVVGVSTLAAMAQQVMQLHSAEQVTVAIDARMGEVYFAQFVNRDGLAELAIEEQVIPPGEAAALCNSSLQFIAGTGWQAYPELAQQCDEQSPEVLYPNAEHMLALAQQQFTNGNVFSAENIEPVYLRDKVTWKKLPGRE